MSITIYDIAHEAKVSIATVSKVINNNGRISTATRERVHKVMNKLGYRPSLLASAMTSKRTFTTGILIPDIGNPFIQTLFVALKILLGNITIVFYFAIPTTT